MRKAASILRGFSFFFIKWHYHQIALYSSIIFFSTQFSTQFAFWQPCLQKRFFYGRKSVRFGNYSSRHYFGCSTCPVHRTQKLIEATYADRTKKAGTAPAFLLQKFFSLTEILHFAAFPFITAFILPFCVLYYHRITASQGAVNFIENKRTVQ